jgi:hypothetical protein
MQSLLQDLRFAFRQMARTPGFALTAILSLALGIGATVSVFSVLYSAILNAWPYTGFDRVCQINTISKSGDEGDPGFTGPQIRQLRQTHAVERPRGREGSLLYGERVSVFRDADDSRPLFSAFRRDRRTRPAARGGLELQLLAATFQQ